MKYRKNFLSSVYFLSTLLLLLDTFIYKNFYMISNNKYVFNNMSIAYNAPNIVYSNSNNFLQINYSSFFVNLCSFKSLYVFNKFVSLSFDGNWQFRVSRQITISLIFFTSFGMFLIKSVNLNSNNTYGKRRCVAIFSVLFSG